MILLKLFILLTLAWIVVYLQKRFLNKKEGMTTAGADTGADTGAGTSTTGADTAADTGADTGAGAAPTAYQSTGIENDPTYLAKLNASNISFLKGQVDSLMNLKSQVTDISGQVSQLSTVVTNLSQHLSSNVSSSTGGCDPKNPSACGINKVAANATS
jgi:hypothetical protein